MARGIASKRPETRAMTARVRHEDYLFLKALADSRGASVNAVVGEAISEFARLLRRREAMRRVDDLCARILEAHGIGTSAVELINEAREERAERLASLSEPREKQ